MNAAAEKFKVGAEHGLLRLLTSYRLEVEDDEEAADLIPEAGVAIETYIRLGLFSEDDKAKWLATIERMPRDSALKSVDANARRRATHYLDALLEAFGDEIGPEEVRSFSSALSTLKAAGFVGLRRSLEYRLRLPDRPGHADAFQGAYLDEDALVSFGSVSEGVTEGKGGFVETAEMPEWAAGWSDFRGRDLVRVIPGPVPTRCGLTVIAAEVYVDGVVFLWHFLRPVDAPLEPPEEAHPGLRDPEQWDERDRREAKFSGGDRIVSLTDDAGTSYRRLWGGFGEWDASRPRVSLGSTTFTPGIPAMIERLILDVAGERVELVL